MSPKFRKRILWVSTGILFVLLVISITRKPSDRADHAKLLELTDTCDRIQGGSISLKEWSVALLHGARPQIYFEEQYGEIQQRLWDSGYITYREMQVTNLSERATALFQAVQNCSRTNVAYFRMQRNLTNGCVEIWCRKQDLAIWERALAGFGTPVRGKFGRSRN